MTTSNAMNMPMDASELDTQPTALVRSRIYQLFAMAISYPDPDWVAAVVEGELATSLREGLQNLDANLVAALDERALSDAGKDEDALAVEYTRLFDIGGDGSPTSLYGGHHHGGRSTAMEEVLRFYKHFGLELEKDMNELPDHLVSELEFLHFMTYQQARIESRGGDGGHYLRGQRDFLERQLGRWLPKLVSKVHEQHALPFFTELFALLLRFVQYEQQQLALLRLLKPSR